MFNRDEPEREKRVYVTVKASDMGRSVRVVFCIETFVFALKITSWLNDGSTISTSIAALLSLSV